MVKIMHSRILKNVNIFFDDRALNVRHRSRSCTCVSSSVGSTMNFGKKLARLVISNPTAIRLRIFFMQKVSLHYCSFIRSIVLPPGQQLLLYACLRYFRTSAPELALLPPQLFLLLLLLLLHFLG